MRQSATRLEDAVIRWGPTLIEDPDSAELLNLLPDIVDSRRGGHDRAGAGPVRRTSGRRARTACSTSWGTQTNSGALPFGCSDAGLGQACSERHVEITYERQGVRHTTDLTLSAD